MKNMSQHTWEIWFLGSIFGCIVPMLAVMCESKDPQVIKNAIIALVFIFLPLLIFNYISDTHFYIEIICMDTVCNHTGIKNIDCYRIYGDLFTITDGTIYHKSTNHVIVYLFLLLMFMLYIVTVVLMFIQTTFPEFYKWLKQ